MAGGAVALKDGERNPTAIGDGDPVRFRPRPNRPRIGCNLDAALDHGAAAAASGGLDQAASGPDVRRHCGAQALGIAPAEVDLVVDAVEREVDCLDRASAIDVVYQIDRNPLCHCLPLVSGSPRPIIAVAELD
jgi:hypothetical protein